MGGDKARTPTRCLLQARPKARHESHQNQPTNIVVGFNAVYGGSVRSPQNLAKGGSAADTVLAHRALFDSIWYNFIKATLLTHNRGGKVAIE